MGDGSISADKDKEKQFQECYNRHYNHLVDYVFYLDLHSLYILILGI